MQLNVVQAKAHTPFKFSDNQRSEMGKNVFFMVCTVFSICVSKALSKFCRCYFRILLKLVTTIYCEWLKLRNANGLNKNMSIIIKVCADYRQLQKLYEKPTYMQMTIRRLILSYTVSFLRHLCSQVKSILWRYFNIASLTSCS